MAQVYRKPKSVKAPVLAPQTIPLMGRNRLGNLLAMEPSIFDEDLIRPRAGHYDARQKYSGYVALQRFRVADGQPVRAFKADPHAFKETEIRTVAGKREHKIVGQRHRAAGATRA